MRVLIYTGLAAFLLLILPITAEGTVRTFTMDGTITGVFPYPPSFPAFAAVGDHVAYTFTFDTEAEDTDPSPGGGNYAGISSQATIKDQTFAGLAPLISIRYGPDMPSGSGWFSVQSGLIPDQSSPFSSAIAFFNLTDTNNSVLTGPNLPEAPYDPSLFASTSFTIKFYAADGSVNYDGMIVPEPGALSLMLLGLPTIWRRRREFM